VNIRLNDNIVRENQFVATHIATFEIEDLGEIDMNVLDDILQRDSLRIQNEDLIKLL
jgi:hypothetical protein